VITLNIKELLDGIDLEGTRPADEALSRGALRAFISYSHKDEILRAELEVHLKLLHRRGRLELWTDRRISAGTGWKGQIDENLDRAELILLLVSADFVASDYCYDIEMTRALARHQAGTARVVPIIIRDVAWRSAPFGMLMALPTDGKAVATWGSGEYGRDTAWKTVAEGIEKVLTELSTDQ
jgi:internalin A